MASSTLGYCMMLLELMLSKIHLFCKIIGDDSTVPVVPVKALSLQVYLLKSPENKGTVESFIKVSCWIRLTNRLAACQLCLTQMLVSPAVLIT